MKEGLKSMYLEKEQHLTDAKNMVNEEEKQKAQFIRMTTVPIEKLLLTLSIPTIISMMVTNIYNLVDTAFVGTLGTSESGATGIVFAPGNRIYVRSGFRKHHVTQIGSKGTKRGNSVRFFRFLSLFYAWIDCGGIQSDLPGTASVFPWQYQNHCPLCRHLHFLHHTVCTLFHSQSYHE